MRGDLCAGMLEAVRKVPLGRSLDLLRCLFPDEYGFHPRSWFLPQQFVEFSDALRHTTTTETASTSVMQTASQRRDQQQQQQQQQLMVVQPAKPSSQSVFIVKPDEGSQGEGIYLIQVMSRACVRFLSDSSLPLGLTVALQITADLDGCCLTLTPSCRLFYMQIVLLAAAYTTSFW